MEVRQYVMHQGDLDDFFRITGKFSKRFYCANYELGHPESATEAWIRVVAVGISRDLKYIIRWNIACNKDKAVYDMFQKENNTDMHVPPFGYIPLIEWELNYFYPRNRHGYKSGNYRNIFEYEGFIETVSITDDKGKNLIEV